MSTNIAIKKLQNTLLLPTIGLGVSVAYLFSIAGILALLGEIFGELDAMVGIALSTTVPLATCALSMVLTLRARKEAASHLFASNFEEGLLARMSNIYSKVINITAIVVAGIIAVTSGIASVVATSGGGAVGTGSQLTFLVSFFVGLVVLYFGIRAVSQMKTPDASAQPSTTNAASAPEASHDAGDSTTAAKTLKGSAINALIIPVFAFIVVPVIASQILISTDGVGGEWVTYGGLAVVAAALAFSAWLLANSPQVRDEAGKLIGGTLIARQWIFGLNFAYLLFGVQFLWIVSFARTIGGGLSMSGDQRTIGGLLTDLIMPVIVLAVMLAAQHLVLVYRAKTPKE
jgi:hypothetical protein